MQMQAAQQPQQPGQTPETGASGQGFNPAAGGESAVPSTGATFEKQRGTTRNGIPLPV